ncbi:MULTISPECIES: chorismate lyase [Glaesserella]|uniref:Chorismate lyase n=1 Tax=Glaesserella australis TaxID=2094024 RepID=A0A328C0X9_9PAST|nr:MULTISPECIES: chorismate lyase [Glaesserella]AUI66898.1 4-hydroxybenzoate synthetase [Glaesserella sp. 15-184]RAL19949.1 chorismate lyase [Glaesserella australis]
MHDFDLYRKILATTAWQTSEVGLPSDVAQWLLHTHSLTEKLQQVCTKLQVEIVQQGWQAVTFEQKFAKTWVREVLLKGDESSWLFAQTLLPEATIDAVAQAVLTLGDKPIGLWLFPQHPQRVTLEWQQDQQTGLYARRSQLLLKGYPLEIRELFLPPFSFETI